MDTARRLTTSRPAAALRVPRRTSSFRVSRQLSGPGRRAA